MFGFRALQYPKQVHAAFRRPSYLRGLDSIDTRLFSRLVAAYGNWLVVTAFSLSAARSHVGGAVAHIGGMVAFRKASYGPKGSVQAALSIYYLSLPNDGR